MARIFACITACCLSCSQAASAAPERVPERLAASSPWRLEYSEDSCKMLRAFGAGDRRTIFLMERFGPSDSFALSVAGKPLQSARLWDGRQTEIDLRFGPSEAAQKISVSPASLDKLLGFLVTGLSFAEEAAPQGEGGRAPAIDPAREAAITNLTISRLARSDVILELGSMGKPMEALRKCIDELTTHWGLDAARFAARTKEAVPASDPRRWMDSDDYPRGMANSGQQGVVQFRLMIGADGKPTSCHIQSSTRPQEFDDAVCKGLMRRARFTPALDADGKPMPSYFLSSVRFQMFG